MVMSGVLFIAAFTPRSQAYAQAIANAGLLPDNVLLFGTPKQGVVGQADIVRGVSKIEGLFTPDYSKSIDETVGQWDATIFRVNENNINSQQVFDQVVKLKPKLVIYSGYGGQIVGSRLLSAGSPFLHMHSGWLPDYKGSTTLYYSWLNEGFCAVSAIIMGEKIDAGPIVARKRFEVPPNSVDPDYVYDSVIRADTLVSVLKEYVRKGGFSNSIKQTNGIIPYYVMHPLLKHITILSKNCLKKGGKVDTSF